MKKDMKPDAQMKTIIIENKWMKSSTKWIRMDVGWGNGYVVLPKSHAWYGMNYNDIPVDVHRGLTFGRILEEKEDLEIFNLGEEYLGWYIIGFDTAHYGDTPERWTKNAVQAEADRLLEQCLKQGHTLETILSELDITLSKQN